MRKCSKAVVWTLILLLFSGCGQRADLPDFAAAFAYNVTITAQEYTIKGEFSRPLLGCYSLRVSWPPELEGLTFCQQNGEVTVSLGQMSAGFPEPFPAASCFGGLVQTLDHLARQESPEPSPAGEGQLGFSGVCDVGTYVAVYHAKTKQLATLKIGDELLVQFTCDEAAAKS